MSADPAIRGLKRKPSVSTPHPSAPPTPSPARGEGGRGRRLIGLLRRASPIGIRRGGLGAFDNYRPLPPSPPPRRRTVPHRPPHTQPRPRRLRIGRIRLAQHLETQ